jgi:hypothetical protein
MGQRGIAISTSAAYSRARALHEGPAVPDQRRAKVVLASLRGVERELESTEPGSPEAQFLQATAARLRSEYQRLVEDVHGHGWPEPPPSPEEPEGP